MFDPHTVYLAGFVSQVVFALTLAMLALTDRRTRGTGWLAVASLLQLLMSLSRSILHSEREVVLLSAGSCVLVLDFFFLYMGLRWFAVRRPLTTRRGPIAVSFAMLVVLAASAFHVALGLNVARLACVALMGITIPMLWRTRIMAMQKTAQLTAGVLGVLALTQLGRIALDVLPRTPGSDLLEVVARVATMVTATLLSFCFVGFFVAETQRRLHDETRVDALTGLRNRRSMEECVARAVHIAAQQSTPLSLLVLDVDLFKNLNDCWGHAVGDRALQALGAVLTHTMGEHVCTARLGGEEFAVLLPGKRMEDAVETAENLRARVAEIRIEEGIHPVSITVSIGVAALRSGERGWIDMLRRADKALYRAKNEGRNRVSMWNERDGTRGSRVDSKLKNWRRPFTPAPVGADGRTLASDAATAEVVN